MITATKPVTKNALDNDLFLEYLEENLHWNGEARCFRGTPLGESQSRALYRWRHENGATFFSADRWLVAVGENINDFFAFCETKDRSPWAAGSPPDWHEEDNWQEDLNSSDPQWREEALAKKR